MLTITRLKVACNLHFENIKLDFGMYSFRQSASKGLVMEERSRVRRTHLLVRVDVEQELAATLEMPSVFECQL